MAKYFIENNSNLVVTIKHNRYNFPKSIVKENLEKGQATFYVNTKHPMVACKCRANKDKANGKQKVVYMLSTCHQPTMEDAPKQIIQKP